MVRNFNPIWLILRQNSSNGICTSIQLVTEGVIMTLGNSGMKILTNVFFQIQPTLRSGSDAELFKLEPNLIHWIKYLKSLASEWIKNVYFNLERLTHSSRLAWPGISTLDRLGTALIKMPNFCKQFDQNEHVYFYFCHLEFEPSGFETWNGVKRPCLASNESSKCTFSESYIIPCQVQGVSDASKCP